MDRIFWMPPVAERADLGKLFSDMRNARHSGEFASNLCALRDQGYSLEHLYGKIPSAFRPIPAGAPQASVVEEIAAIFQQYAQYRLPLTVMTTASDSMLSKAGNVVPGAAMVKSTISFHEEPLVPVHIQINPCASLSTMRHFAYCYAAMKGVLPPDRLMDSMIIAQAKHLFGFRLQPARGGICFDYREGLAGYLFGSKQHLQDTVLLELPRSNHAAGWT